MYLTTDHNLLNDLLLAAGWMEVHQQGGCFETRLYAKGGDLLSVDVPETDVYEHCEVNTDCKLSDETLTQLQLTKG